MNQHIEDLQLQMRLWPAVLQSLKETRPLSSTAITSPSMNVSAGRFSQARGSLGKAGREILTAARPEHNSAVALGRKAAVAVELCLIAPSAVVRQLAHKRYLQGLDEGQLSCRQRREVFNRRKSGPQLGQGLPICGVVSGIMLLFSLGKT